ncbi:MAG: hypothetical protein R3E91_02565 [Chlamydiales bacterium]
MQPLTCGTNPSFSSSDIMVRNRIRNQHITSFALVIISLVFTGLAFTFFGLGTLPAEKMMGFGFFFYLSGVFVGAIGICSFIGALVYLAIASVRAWKNKELFPLLNS